MFPLRDTVHTRLPETLMRLLPLLLALATAAVAGAQQPTPRYDPRLYQHSSADIPMRDGLKLHVETWAGRGPRRCCR